MRVCMSLCLSAPVLLLTFMSLFIHMNAGVCTLLVNFFKIKCLIKFRFILASARYVPLRCQSRGS